MSEKIAIGRVSKAHGVRGDLRIISLSGERDHFLSLREVTVVQGSAERVFAVENIRLHGKGILAKFSGINSPEEAGRLTGGLIMTEREHACPLLEGEYYQADLLECRVLYRGNEVGRVTAVVESGPKDLLEVSTGGGTRLIPFEDEYIGDVRPDEKIIELKLDWLL